MPNIQQTLPTEATSPEASITAEKERTKTLARWISTALATLETIDPDDMEDGGTGMRSLIADGQSLVSAVLQGRDLVPDRRKVQTANHPMRRATDWPQIDPSVVSDKGDLVTLVGVKANGTEEVIGQATMPPLMKARELVREVFGYPQGDGDDSDLALCICEQLIEYMGKPAVFNVTRPASQPVGRESQIPTNDRILSACEKAGLWPNTAASWVENGAFRRFFEALKESEE